MDNHARLAHDLVLAYDAQDQAALERLNAHYRRSFTFHDLAAEIWRRVYAFRQRSSRVAAVTGAPPVDAFEIDLLLAQIDQAYKRMRP